MQREAGPPAFVHTRGEHRLDMQKTAMNTLIEKLIKNGATIEFDDLSHLAAGAAFIDILDCLKEDLLQASFPGKQLIDIGWYPEFCESGSFTVCLIRDHAWDCPVFSTRTRSWPGLEAALNDAIGHLIRVAP